MQTILGAGGVIGNEIAKVLPQYTNKIRLVARNPKAINATDELFKADLTNYATIDEAVKGSEVVYLTVGLPYQLKTWKEHWVKIMQHTITACQKHNSKLVFFDNVYPYGYVKGTMTEETPFNPCSKKGEVRAQVAQLLIDEMKAGNINALISRAADFYGPNVEKSMIDATVFQRLKKGKGAQWLGNTSKKHSFTFVPDAGKATAVLGNTADAYNQTWHVPTDANVLTGKQWVELIARHYNTPAKVAALPKWMVRLLGIFIPLLGELTEMMYQFENDYLFNSSKFESRFFKPTGYAEGIAISAADMQKK